MEQLGQPEPEITEEQTVSIPGEEDLPVRTPTPELLGVYFRSRGLNYKTFYSRNLQICVKSWSVCPCLASL